MHVITLVISVGMQPRDTAMERGESDGDLIPSTNMVPLGNLTTLSTSWSPRIGVLAPSSRRSDTWREEEPVTSPARRRETRVASLSPALYCRDEGERERGIRCVNVAGSYLSYFV